MPDRIRSEPPEGNLLTTREAADRLSMAVRSIQLMVDRGELKAWKTPGGHRRIVAASVDRWLSERHAARAESTADKPAVPERPELAQRTAAAPMRGRQVLLIEDSRHYQTLIRMLLAEAFPSLEVRVADDGIVGLAMAGEQPPDLLIVDVLLPGIDGAALISRLRSHPRFSAMALIVVTSLDDADLEPYRRALSGLPVVSKSRLMTDLPLRLAEALSLEAER